jgi:hypothetical protein
LRCPFSINLYANLYNCGDLELGIYWSDYLFASKKISNGYNMDDCK